MESSPRSSAVVDLLDLFRRLYDKRLLSNTEQAALAATLLLPITNTLISYKITFDVSDIVRTQIEALSHPYYDETGGSWTIEGRNLYINLFITNYGKATYLAPIKKRPVLFNELLSKHTPLNAIINYLCNINLPYENDSWDDPQNAIRYLIGHKVIDISNPKADKETDFKVKTVRLIYKGFGRISVTNIGKNGTSTQQDLSLDKGLNILHIMIDFHKYVQIKDRPTVIWKQKSTPLHIDNKNIQSYGKEDVELGRGGFGRVYLTRSDSGLSKVKEVGLGGIAKEVGLNIAKEAALGGIAKEEKKRDEDTFSNNINSNTKTPVYAIKQALGGEDRDGSVPQDTIREISSLVKCNHPNILDVIDICISKEGSFIVMHAAECTFHDLIPKLSIRQANRYILQILSGLAYLHNADIIHRDIKPGNILVYSCSTNDTPSSNDTQPSDIRGVQEEKRLVITDFGLSRSVVCNNQEELSENAFTAWYRPPELLLGFNYDFKGDIWSAGCTYAEMLTHEALFTPDDDKETLEEIFELLGTPSSEDIKKAPNWSQKYEGLYSRFQKYIKDNKIPQDESELLAAMLLIDPRYRISAFEALGYADLEDFKGYRSCGYSYPLENERECSEANIEMKLPKGIKTKKQILERKELFQFLYSYSKKDDLYFDTLFLTFHLYDLFLHNSKEEDSIILNGYGYTCFSIANKLKEPDYIRVEHIHLYTNKKTSIETLKRYEREILIALGMNVSLYTIYDVLKAIVTNRDTADTRVVSKNEIPKLEEKDLGVATDILVLLYTTDIPFWVDLDILIDNLTILVYLYSKYKNRKKGKENYNLNRDILLKLDKLLNPDKNDTLGINYLTDFPNDLIRTLKSIIKAFI